MARNDDANLDGRLNGEQPVAEKDSLIQRLFYMILISILLSFASTILTLVTVIQFVVMVFSSGAPNNRLADFGTDLGIWIAKAARYQTAASDVKPWPWTDLD
ncbi:DUF4389 domain-containing protein [Gymnodinialimonas sp. 2305UL16-5]|uniref:DUF4389 domain-containing protein n=1 Tax=Gymnodinialimonas mytili TaxID=3126503 RepID=UPI0030A190A7